MNSQCQQIRRQFQQNDAVCGHVLNLFQLIANKARFRIVCMMVQGEFCVQEIMETIDHGKLSNVSQQLKILSLAGIIQKRRDKTRILYSLKDKRLSGLITYLREQFLETKDQL